MESLMQILFIPALLLVAVAVFFIIKWLYYDLTIGQWLDLWKEKKGKKISLKVMVFLIILGIFINFILPRL
ncbi:hypothetical protein [Helicobacter trogontum]|uniref:Uncharacterized protein n=1 Tax=Helicobacter trogontum TaxID=50960 RepID=A0A4U8S9T3_9HELI|nr:hypothetical protein [Helicobacter trogontum]TLD82587.1 hypothetical protein LS81_007505 [Helicobacter trogontum]